MRANKLDDGTRDASARLLRRTQNRQETRTQFFSRARTVNRGEQRCARARCRATTKVAREKDAPPSQQYNSIHDNGNNDDDQDDDDDDDGDDDSLSVHREHRPRSRYILLRQRVDIRDVYLISQVTFYITFTEYSKLIISLLLCLFMDFFAGIFARRN